VGVTLLVSRVGDELAVLRERAGLSRRILGGLAGLSPGTIQLIENGETAQPSPDTLRRLALGLATNRATGHVDEAVTRTVYEGLMAAAGYAPVADENAPSLEIVLGGVVHSPRQAARLAAFLRKYPNMSTSRRRLVDALLDSLEDE
jgi:transcriptional regulator with XRE-family HTH domain